MKTKVFILLSLLYSFSMLAQVGVHTRDPKVSMEIKATTSGPPNGLLLPRVTVEQLDNDASKYGEDQHGTMVYVMDSDGQGPTTSYIYNAGFYVFNAYTSMWHLMDSEPWMSADTGLPASMNHESIYQNGSIGIGTNMINENAQMEITSNSKGLLIPRLSTIQRNGIENPANGLMIFNTTTNCLNYYDGQIKRWLSMCGTYDPAQFTFLNCDPPVGPQGTYTQGSALNTSNTYTLSLNISEPGTYQILINTGNGYSFSGSGVFTETGNQLVVLEGQGSPLNGPTTDEITVKFNGVDVIANCSLPKITVVGASTQFNVNCSQAVVTGDYYANLAVTGGHYVDIPVTDVITTGSILLETPTINGIKFSTGSINITNATTSIRFYAQGTPAAIGSTTYTFAIPTSPAAQCSFTVQIKSGRGTFVQPADRCIQILDENPTATDGYYWVQDGSSNKYKTYCDMSNGGWTLVKSMSEKFILVDFRSQNESIGSQPGRGMVTSQTGKFNEYNFSLPAATVNNVGRSLGATKNFRFTIKEKGHTTDPNATYQEVESTTVAPINDRWTLDNYWNVTTLTGNPATSNFAGNLTNNTSEGKLFGKTLTKPGTTNPDYYYYFDGVRFAANPPGMYSQSGFFTGFYGALGYAGNTSTTVAYVYPSGTAGAGNSFIFRKYDINDLFGLYMNTERQLNHHIGTCSDSTDDFGGESNCKAGWSNWRPHRLNRIGSSNVYEGRIVQYWVK
ncbi:MULTISPECIES: fibrinogen-like YCDxxxxGGGW domain-containing protein [unclassified Myroides]|uniref:fibrinogen-like YCDxxxxGGGW domain-containing protein n=1 Tax=unclassified Myroides TaxID=2642485 RepID=UPI003D2F6405